jgi:hypothetical protein
MGLNTFTVTLHMNGQSEVAIQGDQLSVKRIV